MVSGAVENNIDQLHDVLLEMMHAIDVICQKYNLSYILGHGSLLGAVRHQGFIPWDDDLDILMPREDYNKFKAIVNVELADGYFFECMDNTPEYPYNFGKVRKTGTYFNEPFTAKLNILHCVHIDVFPMDYVDLTRPIRTHIVRRWTGHFTSFRYVKLGIMKMKIKYIPSLFLSLKAINWAANKLMTYTKSSDTVQELCHYGRTKPEINISAFSDIVRVPFEKYEFNIPREYDPILRGSYGDYMTPPPRENQHPTHCVGEFRL